MTLKPADSIYLNVHRYLNIMKNILLLEQYDYGSDVFWLSYDDDTTYITDWDV